MAKLMTEKAAHNLNIKACNDRVAKLQKLLNEALTGLVKAVDAQQKFMAGK